MFHNPYDTIYHLLAARSRGDTAAAVACYEHDARVVVQPGMIETGEPGIRRFTEATMTLPIAFGDREIIEVDGIALHLSKWTLRPANGPEIVGRTTDVLRRQSDGTWLVLIDNPWGVSVLDPTATP